MKKFCIQNVEIEHVALEEVIIPFDFCFDKQFK